MRPSPLKRWLLSRRLRRGCSARAKTAPNLAAVGEPEAVTRFTAIDCDRFAFVCCDIAYAALAAE